MDVLDIHSGVQRAIARARNESKPTLIEAMTYRFRGHSMADPASYRSKEEAEQWRSTRDPIALLEKKILDAGLANDQDFKSADDQATALIEGAARFADESPFPDVSELTADIMIDPEGGLSWRHQR